MMKSLQRTSRQFDNHFKRQLSSVSRNEVNKFSAMSSIWWDSSKNPLIGMNPTRMQFIVEQLRDHFRELNRNDSKVLDGLKALDVGCGGGLLSESLARLGAAVTAIDPSTDIVQIAKEHAAQSQLLDRIDYRAGISIEQLLDEKAAEGGGVTQEYDLICLLEILEHVDDPSLVLASASKLLKKPTEAHPGGLIFVSTINRNPKSFLFAILGAEYITRLLPIGTHDHSKFLKPQEIAETMKSLDMEQRYLSGMVLQPALSFKWGLDKNDLDVNWIGSYRFK